MWSAVASAKFCTCNFARDTLAIFTMATIISTMENMTMVAMGMDWPRSLEKGWPIADGAWQLILVHFIAVVCYEKVKLKDYVKIKNDKAQGKNDKWEDFFLKKTPLICNLSFVPCHF